MKYQINTFADIFVFFLYDAAKYTEPQFIEQAYYLLDEEYNYQEMCFYRDSLLIVGTIRNMTVPITIEILDKQPDTETYETWYTQSDHVCISAFEVIGKQLTVQNAQFVAEEVTTVQIPEGVYELVILYRNLSKLSEDALEGEDEYHIIFYPGKLRETKIIKRYLLT